MIGILSSAPLLLVPLTRLLPRRACFIERWTHDLYCTDGLLLVLVAMRRKKKKKSRPHLPVVIAAVQRFH